MTYEELARKIEGETEQAEEIDEHKKELLRLIKIKQTRQTERRNNMAMQYSVEAILSARDSNFTSTMDNAQKAVGGLGKSW